LFISMSFWKAYTLLVFISNIAVAQQTNWQWAHNVGVQITDPYVGLGYETYASSVATDVEGNIYVAGIFSDSIIVDGFAIYSTPNSAFPTQVDVFVAKYNSGGKLLWLKQFGSSGPEKVNGTAVDADNNLYICGQYAGDLLTGEDTLITIPVKNNGFNGYIVRCSPEGNFDWAIPCHAENQQTTVLGIGATGRTVMVAGRTSAPGGLLTLADKQIPNEGVFAAKISSYGVVDWLQTVQAEASHRMGVSALPNGESYIASKNKIVKYDSQGNEIKTINIKGGAFTAIASNKTYFCGVGTFLDSITVGNITFTQPNLGMFAATYSHDGVLQNFRIAVGPQSEANSICADSVGGFYVTGTFVQSIRFDENIAFADQGFSSYVVHFRSDHRASTLVTPHTDSGACILGSITTTATNEAMVSGSFHKKVEFPPYLVTGPTWFADVVVAKLQQPGSAVMQQQNRLKFSVYPSPASNVLNVSYGLPSISSVVITLYDLLGREVVRLPEGSLREGEHSAALNVSPIKNGIYCLRLQAGDYIESRIIHIVK
jgi:hypothetical protein